MIPLLAGFMLEANGELMEKTPGDTPEERASYWVGIINEGRQYLAGGSAYCRDYNISEHDYYVWFGKLRPSRPEWKKDLSQPPKQKRKTRTQPASAVPPQTEVRDKASRRYFSAAEKQNSGSCRCCASGSARSAAEKRGYLRLPSNQVAQ